MKKKLTILGIAVGMVAVVAVAFFQNVKITHAYVPTISITAGPSNVYAGQYLGLTISSTLTGQANCTGSGSTDFSGSQGCGLSSSA